MTLKRRQLRHSRTVNKWPGGGMLYMLYDIDTKAVQTNDKINRFNVKLGD